MPSFINVGAYVDAGTMADTWATVGSGAQIGKNVHLSGGAGIGGVLEPPEAWSVCVGGTRTRQFGGGEFGMPCMLVLRRLPAGRRHDKTELNAILRDHGVDA
ncbi:MAG TPA: hypothetical protein VKG80_12610 [Trebonia sp.]|nr:hypothetical protein [Trebonia sp.]